MKLLHQLVRNIYEEYEELSLIAYVNTEEAFDNTNHKTTISALREHAEK